jgi:predicted PurR-regulated permease PerM
MKPPRSVSISTSTFVKAVLIVLGIWFLWFVRDIVGILISAMLLSALIAPFADWFEKRSIPRGLAVLIVYVLLISITLALLILMIPVVTEQGVQLVANLGQYYDDAAQSVGHVQQLSEQYGLTNEVNASIQTLQDWMSSWSSSIFTGVTSVIGGFAAVVVILVLTFYMVVEEGKVRKSFDHLVPPEYQPYTTHILKKIQKKIGDWLRAQMILSLSVGFLVFIALTVLGVKYALLLALLAALFEVVPYVGPVAAVIPALIVGFSISPLLCVAVLVVYITIQQLENHVLVPKIMQKVTGLSPIISITALLIGIKVAGLLGAIISIPLAMMISVVLEDLFAER